MRLCEAMEISYEFRAYGPLGGMVNDVFSTNSFLGEYMGEKKTS